MPKRIVDGPGVWKSVKLSQVQPVEFRAEFANLIPLATASGSFECNPSLILHEVYGFNRPDMTLEKLTDGLSEFGRVKLLFRWTEPSGKVWGYWVGINRQGLLPPPSRTNHEFKGPLPPPDLLKAFLQSPSESVASQRVANGLLGIGMGICKGEGGGNGAASQRLQGQDQPPLPHSQHTETGQDEVDLVDYVQQIAKARDDDASFSGKSLSALREVCSASDFTLPEIRTAVEFRVNGMDEFQIKNAGSLLASNLKSDITEIRRREERTRQTEERVRKTYESEQRKAAEELAARIKADEDEQALVEESLS